jgi:hypothetical protein
MWNANCVTVGVGMVSIAVAVVIAKAQGNPDAWYGSIVHSSWALYTPLAMAGLCFFLVARRSRQFRAFAWKVLAWVVPRPIEPGQPTEEASSATEDSRLQRVNEQLQVAWRDRQEACERVNTLAVETNTANAKVREQEREIADLIGNLGVMRAELQPFKKVQAEVERVAELLKNAPNFMVTYVNGRSAWQKLALTHADGSMAVEVRVGDVVSINTRKVTTIPSAVPLVGGGQEGECSFMVEGTIKGTGESLPDVLRGGGEHTPVAVSVSYQDPQGNHYEREFALTREADDSVRWTPGPIKLRDFQAARSA